MIRQRAFCVNHFFTILFTGAPRQSFTALLCLVFRQEPGSGRMEEERKPRVFSIHN